MLKTLKDLFDALTGAPTADSPEAQANALKLACAVLLIEVTRADATMDTTKRHAMTRLGLGQRLHHDSVKPVNPVECA
jgi:uncharacterized tellurite resistance protein B-like protein